MNIKIHSAELNRMMKTLTKCIGPRDLAYGNIEVIYNNNQLTLRGTNGQFAAVMSTPMLGGTGETFCVDGTMFANVCAMQSGEIEIIADEKTCTVKGVGRTRIPIVQAKVPAFERVDGKAIFISGEDFSECYGRVAYAVSADQSRIQLTGVCVESDGETARFVALDGFQMSMEEMPCDGESAKATIPGAFMKMVAASVGNGMDVKLTVSGSAAQAESDGVLLKCGLLTGDYPDWRRILPTAFGTMVKVSTEAVRDALKAGNVVSCKQHLVKLIIGSNSVSIRNNGESAEFEAEVACETQGNGLTIAFNDKYLMNTMSATDSDKAEMSFNSATSPVVVKSIGGKGIRLVLPVRIQ